MWISWKSYCTPGFLQPPDLCLDFWEGSPTAAPLHSRDARCTRPTDVAAEKKDCCKRGCPWARQRLGFLQILYMFWTDVQVLHRFRCVSCSWSMIIYGVSDGVIVKLETIEAFSFWSHASGQLSSLPSASRDVRKWLMIRRSWKVYWCLLHTGQKLPCYTRSTLSHKDHHCNQPIIIKCECNTCCFHCSPAHYVCSWMAFHGMCHFCKSLVTFRPLEVQVRSVGNSQFPGWRHLSFAL